MPMHDRSYTSVPTIGALARVAEYAATPDVAAGVIARFSRRLASPAAVLLLCAVSAAFFWKVILLHQVLLPADILYSHDPLWGPLAPRPVPLPVNPLDSDALTEFYPWTALAANALHHGIVPLWNPYAFAGTPFLGAMQTAVFYPINLILEWVLSPADVLGVRAAVHLAVTLVGTFFFARRLALSRPAALLAALSFGLGLPYMVWLEHPMSSAIAWLPWLLLAVDYVITARRRVWPALGLAAVVALELLAGHGESTAHALMLCVAYALWRVARSWRDNRRVGAVVGPLALLAGASALGTAIAAAHLLPSLAQISASEASADRTLALGGASLPLLGDPTQWKTLVLALIPDFFGNPTWHMGGSPLVDGGYNELALYDGSIPLVLAVIALWRHRTASTLFFGAVALIALGMALRLPLAALLDALPVLRVAQNGRLRVEYAFALAVLAGYGLDALVQTAMRRGTWRLVWLWLLGLGVCAAAGIALLLPAQRGAHDLPLGTVAEAALPVVWLALFAVALWLYRAGRLNGAVLRALAPALCAVDLFTLGVGYHATVPLDTVTATPPAVQAIGGDHSLYRVVGLGTALWPSLSSLYGLQDVRGYDPAYAAAYEQYFAASFGKGGMRLALAAAGPSPAGGRALDLMNVKYIFSACAVRLNARYYQRVYGDGSGCVYRNRSVMPRAFVVHDVRWAAPAHATALLGSGAVDPRMTALLDPATIPSPPTHADWSLRSAEPTAQPCGLVSLRCAPTAQPALPNRGRGETIPSPSIPLSTSGRVKVTSSTVVTYYGLNDVDVTVRDSAPGVLVLGDTYAPGWRARIDGRPATLARTDAVFRAVPVPAGTHRVSFTYEPRAFTVGVRISLIALALWGMLLALALGWSVMSGIYLARYSEEH